MAFYEFIKHVQKKMGTGIVGLMGLMMSLRYLNYFKIEEQKRIISRRWTQMDAD